MKWPGQVLVLERGKRYPLGSFPRAPRELSRNLWNLPISDEMPLWKRLGVRSGLRGRVADEELHGLFDFRSYDHVDLVQSAGLGGGSLIYANVFLFPPEELFQDERWPATCKFSDLYPYYEIARKILHSRRLPGYRPDDPSVVPDNPRRRVIRTELFRKVG